MARKFNKAKKNKFKKKPIKKKIIKNKVLKSVIKNDTRSKLVRDVVSSISGQGSDEIVGLLYGRENVNEFIIAKKLDITINQARNILYKLADEGLVSFIRKKDKKNGGWYTYFWTLDIGKSLFVLQKRLSERIENLENQLKSKQTKRFYFCPNCDVEMSEENALLNNFICPECGEVFELKDNSESIEGLINNIVSFKNVLSSVDGELENIKQKEEISKAKKAKLEEKRKKAERNKKKRQRDLEKRKLEKKLGKKAKVKSEKRDGKKRFAKRKTLRKKYKQKGSGRLARKYTVKKFRKKSEAGKSKKNSVAKKIVGKRFGFKGKRKFVRKKPTKSKAFKKKSVRNRRR